MPLRLGEASRKLRQGREKLHQPYEEFLFQDWASKAHLERVMRDQIGFSCNGTEP